MHLCLVMFRKVQCCSLCLKAAFIDRFFFKLLFHIIWNKKKNGHTGSRVSVVNAWLLTWWDTRGNGGGGQHALALGGHSSHLNSVGGESSEPGDPVL